MTEDSKVLEYCSFGTPSVFSRCHAPFYGIRCFQSVLYSEEAFCASGAFSLLRCAPGAFSILRGASGAFAVLRVPPCSRRLKMRSLNLLRPGTLSWLPLFFPSWGTFKSPSKCDYRIDVCTRLSSRKQKGWRRRHPFLAARLLIKTLFGTISLALSCPRGFKGDLNPPLNYS
jgi:hypothetical protein